MRVQNTAELEPHEAAQLHREREETHAFWKERLEAIHAAQDPSIPDLFKGAINGLGKPIEAGVQDKILDYLNAPSLAAWIDLRSFCVGADVTLWEAWGTIDPAAPRTGTGGPYPSPEVLREAIRNAVEAQLARVQRKLLEHPAPGPRLRLVR